MISPEMLRRFPLFAGLDPGAYKQLAMAGSEISISAGTRLFSEDDTADALYLILDGSIDLSINIDAKGEHYDDISTVGQGQMVGWSALVEPYIYTLNATADTDASLVRLEAAAVRTLMDENPAMGYVLMKHLAKAIGERLTNLRVQFVSLAKM
jgi:CRP-like cAMP-binding protein